MIYLLGFLLQENHLFGFSNEEGLRDQLSFNARQPWRLMGSTLLSSLFIHFNLAHFMQNFLFFTWFGFLSERFLGWKNFIGLILLSHILPLIFLGSFLTGDHYFLGASLAATGLFIFFTINRRKWSLLIIGVLVLVAYPIYEGSDINSTYAHALAIITSGLLTFMGQKFLWFKQA